MRRTLYHILGVASDADSATIAAAYARLQAGFESGAIQSSDHALAREAFGVLSNPDKRTRYDASLLPPPVIRAEPAGAARKIGARESWMIIAGGTAGALLTVGLIAWLRSVPPPAPPPAPAPAAAPPALVQARPAPAPEAPAPAPSAAVAAALPNASTALGMEALFAKLSPSVARINVMGPDGRVLGSGSGVLLGGDAVITNCHVALGGPGLQVRVQDAVHEARVAVADEELDLCRLSVPALNAPALVIGDSDALRTGQRVVAIGAPQGLDLTISDGIVSSLRKLEGGTLIQTTAPVSPGSSGGGLFDDSGRLVGIVTFQFRSGQNLNFAAPADWIALMRTRSGNGLIGKLTGPETKSAAGVPGRPSNADEAAMMVGDWQCRSVLGGSSNLWMFAASGSLQVIRDNQPVRGSWRFYNRHVQVQFGKTVDTLAVEEMSDQKMVFKAGAGERKVCMRQ